jgi:hypothetical protein
MKISVKSVNGQQFFFNVNPTDTVLSLIEKICDKCNISSDSSYRLFLKGEALLFEQFESNVTLNEAKITDGVWLQIIANLRGGGVVEKDITELDSFKKLASRPSDLDFESGEESKIDQISYISHPWHQL